MLRETEKVGYRDTRRQNNDRMMHSGKKNNKNKEVSEMSEKGEHTLFIPFPPPYMEDHD